MNEEVNIVAAALSDKGRVRDSNEDRAFYCKLDITDGNGLGIGLLAAVADGMGGHAAGEAASERAIQVVQSLFRSAGSSENETTDWTRTMEEAVRQANAEVFEESKRWQGRSGMGTTLTAVALVKDKLYVGHVGDSRAYLLRKGKISPVTEDDTWIAEQMRKGLMTHEQAEASDKAGQLTKALGIKSEIEPSIKTIDLLPGDTILLCTDGLTGVVGDQEISGALDKPGNPQKICERLVGAANRRGGPDNIAVVILSYIPQAASQTRARERKLSRKAMIAGLAAVLVLLGVDIAYLASQYTSIPKSRPKPQKRTRVYKSPVTITVRPAQPKPQGAPQPEEMVHPTQPAQPAAEPDRVEVHKPAPDTAPPAPDKAPGLIMRDMSGEIVDLSEGGGKR